MDKTIQLVVVAMVAIIAALVLSFMLQDQTGGFGEFLDSQRSDANCSTIQTQVQNGMISEDEFSDKTEDLDTDCPLPDTESG